MKKFVAFFMILGFLAFSAPQAKAVTLEDLQKQIQSLTEQVNALKSQLKGQVVGALGEVGDTTKIIPEVNPTPKPDPTPTPTPKPDPTPTPTPNPTVTAGVLVYTPNGGESYTVGKTVNVTWKTVGLTTTDLVDIKMFNKVGTAYSNAVTLASKITNDGNETVTIPASTVLGSTYVIQVSVSAKNVSDYSNSTFSIVANVPPITGTCISTTAPSITVLSPNGGETYTDGQQITVKWKSCNIPANHNVDIALVYFASNVGAIQYAITTSQVNDGLEVITLPTILSLRQGTNFGKNFRVFLQSHTSNPWVLDGFDSSDNTFTINPASTTPSLTLLSPNGGETYTEGQQITVTWNSQNIPATANNINLQLNFTFPNGSDGGLNYGNSLNTGSRVFTLPSPNATSLPPTLIDRNTFKIVIGYNLGTQSFVDFSDNTFTINPASTAPSIKVLSPNGGETYTAGQQITVKWETSNIPATATIYLLIDQADTANQIAASTNDGIETFILQFPGNNIYTYGNNFKIMAWYQESSSSLVTDLSDNTFTINPATNSTSKSTLTPSTSKTPTIATPSASSGVVSALILKKGLKSSMEVLKVQVSLNNLGYNLTADGNFGTKTENAVKSFQKSKGIKVDGIITPAVLKLIN
ncbi:MAG: Ser-Thr-rich GPI-anchored membrane family protein [bacterium]